MEDKDYYKEGSFLRAYALDSWERNELEAHQASPIVNGGSGWAFSFNPC